MSRRGLALVRLMMGAAGDVDRATFPVVVADQLPPATAVELREGLELGDETTRQPVGVAGACLNRRHGTWQGRREGSSDEGERGVRKMTQQSGRFHARAGPPPRARRSAQRQGATVASHSRVAHRHTRP
jgi:hypothetical protein